MRFIIFVFKKYYEKILISILYLLILISLLSCSKFISQFVPGSSAKKFTTGIKGQVFISPVSPVEKVGAFNKVPYEAVLKFINSDEDIIEKIRTDEKGQFKVKLKPGIYTIIPEPITFAGNYPVGENKNITVKQNEISFVEVDFDSGIR
jgi:hypothetical protein